MNQHLADISVSSTVGWETSSQDICSVKSNCVMEPCESVKCQYLKSQAIHHVVTLSRTLTCWRFVFLRPSDQSRDWSSQQVGLNEPPCQLWIVADQTWYQTRINHFPPKYSCPLLAGCLVYFKIASDSQKQASRPQDIVIVMPGYLCLLIVPYDGLSARSGQEGEK